MFDVAASEEEEEEEEEEKGGSEGGGGKEKKRPTAETYVRVLNAIAPGLLGAYDASRSLAAIAPRPLLLANGQKDGRVPSRAVDEAASRAIKVFESHGKRETFELFLDEDVGHEYTSALEEKVDSFLDRWLLLRE